MLGAFNAVNPMYYALVGAHQCAYANSATAAGYNCLNSSLVIVTSGTLITAPLKAALHGGRAKFCLPKGAGPAQPSLGSTGRTVASDLKEQLSMEQAMSNPAGGARLPIAMSDPRWPASDGWIRVNRIRTTGNLHSLARVRNRSDSDDTDGRGDAVVGRERLR